MCTDLNQNNTIINGATNGSGRNTVTKDKKVPPPGGMGDDEAPLGVTGLAMVVADRGPAHKQPTDQIISNLLKNRYELIF